MEEAFEKLYLNQMTQQGLYKIFGIKEVEKLEALDNWLNVLPPLTEAEKTIAKHYHRRLLKNISSWSEQELSLGFIGPLIHIIDFKVPYQLNFFAQRPISAVVGNYELMGKPDGMLAAGNFEPENPFFAFQEYKKDINSSGDPAGQNLAAMLVGQAQNQAQEIIYGCYIVGRNWYFMVLEGKEFAVSKDYSATHEDDILKIVQILKGLRDLLLVRLGLPAMP
ncbi:MAG: hypothetical protein AAF960_25135 [Bacteroidota bacterium]